MSQAHQYSIRPKNPAAHLFEVCLTVAAPDPDGQVFAMPAWIPGSYMIRDYAKHVVSIRAESDGRAVSLQKIDKSRWQAAPVDRSITLFAEIYAFDDSVRGAHLDSTHAYFNGSCVFLEVVGQGDIECVVDIQPPDGDISMDWRVATSMQRKDAAEYAFGSYSCTNYAELIDHPVEISQLAIGEFDVAGIPHAIAIRGRTRVDMARICRDLKILCEQHIALLGPPADLDRYLFLLYAPGSGYGGLEHRWSSSLVCSRDNLPQRGDTDVSDGYRTFLGLASHEYFHLWNVKRLKPAVFTPYDLAVETHTSLLWVFEGITSYYDDLVLARSGLITEESYLELLGQTITRVLRSGGRSKQSVADSSFDAWTKFYKQDANAPNAIISYYAKGSLIAATLDLKLRIETDGETTLDDVMRESWARWGSDDAGMPEDGFETVCKELVDVDLDDFFDAAIRGTGELPLRTMLEKFGIEYHMRQARDGSDKGGKPVRKTGVETLWLGANLSKSNGKLVFKSVLNGGPAEEAGIAPGDVAVALDGVALTAGNNRRRLKSYRDGDLLDLVVFRGDELITTQIRLAKAPEDNCYLRVDDDADIELMSRRNDWLQST
ncbi:MAG: M61 family metallopeptidase [Woeseiaceae bacterium]